MSLLRVSPVALPSSFEQAASATTKGPKYLCRSLRSRSTEKPCHGGVNLLTSATSCPIGDDLPDTPQSKLADRPRSRQAGFIRIDWLTAAAGGATSERMRARSPTWQAPGEIGSRRTTTSPATSAVALKARRLVGWRCFTAECGGWGQRQRSDGRSVSLHRLQGLPRSAAAPASTCGR